MKFEIRPFILLIFISTYSFCQKIATFEVETNKINSANTLASIDLENITFVPEDSLQLFEIISGSKIPVTFQIDQSSMGRKLWFNITGENSSASKRIFELERVTKQNRSAAVTAEWQKEVLLVSVKNKPVIQYNYNTVYPPAGVDTSYRRSGFLHPVWTPSGEVLTKIQPKDHYHHYGIWNPWTKTTFDGDTIDFWNLADKKGTVRFNGFGAVYDGDVFGGFRALHEHVVVKKQPEKVALNEEWDVRVYNVPSQKNDLFIWDFTSTLSCASDIPITFEKYRYGGFVFRATEAWTNKNSKILTSEGNTRKEANGSTAKWCLVTGKTGTSTSGILIMGYPTNFNYPEPLRVWPEDANGNRGDVFVNFSPTQNKPWPLQPGKKYVLRYRIITFSGELTPEEAEQAWNDFANPPKVRLIKLY